MAEREWIWVGRSLDELRDLDERGHHDCFLAIDDTIQRWCRMDPTLTAHNVKNIGDSLQEVKARIGRRQLRVYFRVDNGIAYALTAFDKANGSRAEKKARKRASKRWKDHQG